VRNTFALTVMALVLASCADSAGVIQIGPNRYLFSVGNIGVAGAEAWARNKAAEVATNYCQGAGKTLNVTRLESRGPSNALGIYVTGSASVEFQCLAKDSGQGGQQYIHEQLTR
jgi:hypothetical protein